MNIFLNRDGQLTLWILSFLGLSWLTARATHTDSSGWYDSLEKPLLTPPDFVFPIVWSVLYIMIAAAGWLFWRERNNSEQSLFLFFLFSLQAVMNWGWSFIFFSLHLLGLSVFWVLSLTACVGFLIRSTQTTEPRAAILLLPYFFWLTYASFLAFSVWLSN